MKKWTSFRKPGLLLVLIAAWFASAWTWAGQTVTAVRVSPAAPGNTRVVFDLSGPAQYKLFTLDNPARVVVDFADTGNATLGIGIPTDSHVSTVRSAVQPGNGLRMVLDLKKAAGVKGFLLPPDGQSGHRLVVDINGPGGAVAAPAVAASGGGAHIYGRGNAAAGQVYQTSSGIPVSNRPALLEPAVTTQSGSVANASRPAAVPVASGVLNPSAAVVSVVPKVATPTVVSQPVNKPAPVAAAKAAPRIAKPVVAAKPAVLANPAPVTQAVAVAVPKATPQVRGKTPVKGGMRDVVVAIDAGHGGQDPGAVGPRGTHEKHVTLAIAKRLQAELNRREGVTAKLVRTGDYFIPLASRRDIARTRLKADLFVSIHADAALSRKAKGASVFTLSRTGATSSLAQMLADRENQADLVGGALGDKDNMVASVIADLALEGAMEHSMKVGGTVLRELGGTTPLHKRYIEKAGFAVLKSADFPSILVETGFISNPGEESMLTSAGHQQKLAQAITRGVMTYFEGHPPPGTYLAWKREKRSQSLASR